MTFWGRFSKTINFWTLFWIVWKVYVFKFDFDVDQICLKSFRVDFSQRGRWIMAELRAQAQIRWWQMSVIFYKFANSLIHYKIDLGSFPSSKIGRRIRFWALENLKLYKNSEIIEKTNLYDISRCIGNISANRGHSPILQTMPELTAWAVLIVDWLVELIPSSS